jgi:hypothetical protein
MDTKKKNKLHVFVKKLIKKLLAPVMREVIKEREDEIIKTTLRVGQHSRCKFL